MKTKEMQPETKQAPEWLPISEAPSDRKFLAPSFDGNIEEFEEIHDQEMKGKRWFRSKQSGAVPIDELSVFKHLDQPTLPPGLPELPTVPDGFDRWEYRGYDYISNASGKFATTWHPFSEWNVFSNIQKAFGDSSLFYIEAIPATPPVVETIDPIMEQLRMMTALCRIKWGNLDPDVYAEILKADALIAAARKQP